MSQDLKMRSNKNAMLAKSLPSSMSFHVVTPFFNGIFPTPQACGPSGTHTMGTHAMEGSGTVGGRNPANLLRLVDSPIIYRVLAPSQVVIAGFLNHQQYVVWVAGGPTIGGAGEIT